MSSKTAILCGALLASAAACRADVIDAAGVGPRLSQLPQNWQDDRAHELTLASLQGHRVVLTMAYATCHRICPTTMGDLERMQRSADARGETIDFVVVGYDPKNDGPTVWHRYRRSRGLTRANWFFLSGSETATKQLARQLGFPFWKMDDHVMHESRAVLFDSQGTQRTALSPPSARWIDAL